MPEERAGQSHEHFKFKPNIHGYRVCQELRLNFDKRSEIVIFESLFTIFEVRSICGGSWTSDNDVPKGRLNK